MIDFRQLRYFVAIVDAGSLTRAAAVLHIAQSALSQQMISLESDIGDQLLNRSVKGVVPTEAGWAVYRHAQTILKLTAQTVDVARSAGSQVSGRVRLGLPSSIAMILVPPLIEKLTHRFPAVLIEIYESPSAYLAAQLFDEHVDLSVILDKIPPAALVGQPLVNELLYFVRARGIKPAQEQMTIAQIAEVPLILTTRATTLRHMIDAEFGALNIIPRVCAEASSIQTLLTVVAQGSMSTIIPYSALAWPAVRQSLDIAVISPPIPRHASLAWSRTAALTEATRCVKALIVETVRELITAGQWEGATFLVPADSGCDAM